MTLRNAIIAIERFFAYRMKTKNRWKLLSDERSYVSRQTYSQFCETLPLFQT